MQDHPSPFRGDRWFRGARPEDLQTFSFDCTTNPTQFNRIWRIYFAAFEPTSPCLEFFLTPVNGLNMTYIETIHGVRQARSLLRIQKVQALTGLARSTLYKLVLEKDFPSPIPLTGRTVAWDSVAVDAWIRARIAKAAA